MTTYLSLRGWVECDEQHLEEIRKTLVDNQNKIDGFSLNSEQANLYFKGWRFPEHSAGWQTYVFFGADIKSDALDYIIAQFEAVTVIDSELTGYLFVSDDEGVEKNVLSFQYQSCKTASADFLY